MDWEEALELCEEIQDLLEELPDRAEDFGQSIGEKVSDMTQWIEENERVTPRQVNALENMRSGCEKWIR